MVADGCLQPEYLARFGALVVCPAESSHVFADLGRERGLGAVLRGRVGLRAERVDHACRFPIVSFRLRWSIAPQHPPAKEVGQGSTRTWACARFRRTSTRSSPPSLARIGSSDANVGSGGVACVASAPISSPALSCPSSSVAELSALLDAKNFSSSLPTRAAPVSSHGQTSPCSAPAPSRPSRRPRSRRCTGSGPPRGSAGGGSGGC